MKSWDSIKAFGVGVSDKIYENFGLTHLMWERTLELKSKGTLPYAIGQLGTNLFSLTAGDAEFIGGGLWSVGGSAAVLFFYRKSEV